MIVAAAIAALLAGCASPAPAPVDPTPTEAPYSCANPEGGKCLGPVTAGTYSTVIMTPKITYTLPDGWSNWEDTPGNFLLVPPDNTLEGVNAGTSDFIGIYTRVAASTYECDQHVDMSVGAAPKDIAAYFTTAPDLESTSADPTSIGGLDGYVVDVRQAEGKGIQCDQWFMRPTFVGEAPSSLTHSTLPGMVIRHYLLAYNDATLVIEVVDLTGGSRLDEYDKIVKQLVFGV